jgi:hypothetical protein
MQQQKEMLIASSQQMNLFLSRVGVSPATSLSVSTTACCGARRASLGLGFLIKPVNASTADGTINRYYYAGYGF